MRAKAAIWGARRSRSSSRCSTRLRGEGLDVVGPLPADTLFTPRTLAGCDCVLAMYHDQGLPVLKYAIFGAGVNVTLGLPFVRTSVDHGTALDLAGTRPRRSRQPVRSRSTSRSRMAGAAGAAA